MLRATNRAADCVWLDVPKPTERQCVEDYIDVAFIFKAGHTADDGCSSAPMRALSSLSAHTPLRGTDYYQRKRATW